MRMKNISNLGTVMKIILTLQNHCKDVRDAQKFLEHDLGTLIQECIWPWSGQFLILLKYTKKKPQINCIHVKNDLTFFKVYFFLKIAQCVKKKVAIRIFQQDSFSQGYMNEANWQTDSKIKMLEKKQITSLGNSKEKGLSLPETEIYLKWIKPL